MLFRILVLTIVGRAAHYSQQCCSLWSTVLLTMVDNAAHYGRHQKI